LGEHKSKKKCHDEKIQKTEQLNELKKEKEKLENDLSKVKNKSDSEKIIKKLEEQMKKLRREMLFHFRSCCEEMEKIQKKKRTCSGCRKVENEKKLKNPLRHVCLVNKAIDKPQLILLTRNLVCRYDNKDNFASFFDDKRKKIKKKMLRGKGKEISDIKFYSSWKIVGVSKALENTQKEE
ncbi:29254_t:CDS:1, partial [Racocetra persica]